jgi:hypothetical protein
MSKAFDPLIKEATGIPWSSAAAFMHELRYVPKIPEPRMTKNAAAGIFKLANMRKIAQSPEQLSTMQQKAMLTDPQIVAALDYQQSMAEKQALEAQVQNLAAQNQAMQVQMQSADMMAQQAAQQSQQMQDQVNAAQQEKQMAIQQAIQSKDETLASQMSHQEHRQQIMGAADQLASQIKQIASVDPAQAQMQQEQAAQAEAQIPPQTSKSLQEQEQAQKAQQESEIQAQQAQQAQEEDAARLQASQEQQAAQEQQMGAEQGVPKTSSLRQKIAALKKKSSVVKIAAAPPPNVIKSLPKSIGMHLLYGAGGSGISGGYEAIQQARIKDRTKPGPRELSIKAELAKARELEKSDPSFDNKINTKELQKDLSIEEIKRLEPTKAIASAAAKGFVPGMFLGGIGKKFINVMRKRKLELNAIQKQNKALEEAKTVLFS